MFGRCRQKARVLKATLSNTRPKNWMNRSRGSLPKFAKVMALIAGQSKGYVSCSRQTPQKKRQQTFHSEGPRIC